MVIEKIVEQIKAPLFLDLFNFSMILGTRTKIPHQIVGQITKDNCVDNLC